jgi:hypothetical protein
MATLIGLISVCKNRRKRGGKQRRSYPTLYTFSAAFYTVIERSVWMCVAGGSSQQGKRRKSDQKLRLNYRGKPADCLNTLVGSNLDAGGLL